MVVESHAKQRGHGCSLQSEKHWKLPVRTHVSIGLELVDHALPKIVKEPGWVR